MKIDFSPQTYNYYKKVVSDVAIAVCVEEGQTEKIQVGVNFVSADEIKQLNKTFRGIEQVTDTLSFPFVSLVAGETVCPTKFALNKDPLTGHIMLGEVYLNDEQITKQADEFGHSFKRELAYITAHSILHLLGYDHQNEKEEQLMAKKCEKITVSAGYER